MTDLHDMDFDDDGDGWDSFVAECAGCDTFAPLDDLGLCGECSEKLDRDMIRQRDWDYSETAWACPPEKVEELRALIVKQYGKELELIAPSTSQADRPKSKSKKKSRRQK